MSVFIGTGFMDCRDGMILAITNLENAYYKYLKLNFLVAEKS
jgi:hypothetical protein